MEFRPLALAGLAATALGSRDAEARDLQGAHAFMETVAGHLKYEPGPSNEAIVYLVLDEVSGGFNTDLRDTIKAGNTLNRVGRAGLVEFRLGCDRGGQILDEQGKIVLEDTSGLHGASPNRPVSVELHFALTQPGEVATAGTCASLADRIVVKGFTDTARSD